MKTIQIFALILMIMTLINCDTDHSNHTITTANNTIIPPKTGVIKLNQKQAMLNNLKGLFQLYKKYKPTISAIMIPYTIHKIWKLVQQMIKTSKDGKAINKWKKLRTVISGIRLIYLNNVIRENIPNRNQTHIKESELKDIPLKIWKKYGIIMDSLFFVISWIYLDTIIEKNQLNYFQDLITSFYFNQNTYSNEDFNLNFDF